jgi:hypothetical protein
VIRPILTARCTWRATRKLIVCLHPVIHWPLGLTRAMSTITLRVRTLPLPACCAVASSVSSSQYVFTSKKVVEQGTERPRRYSLQLPVEIKCSRGGSVAVLCLSTRRRHATLICSSPM